MQSPPGIYVEIPIAADLNRVWQLTQQPDLHQRWDLRFTRIEYLPRPDASRPQKFLYETRLGFGLRIAGTGESMGTRESGGGVTTSALQFASDNPWSLIEKGAGYWKYVPGADGLRFFTWYDYEVRFGAFGRFVDRVAFRPLIGWATAWSFDRMRLWAEEIQSPEVSLSFALINAVVRISIAFIWFWQGLVPKILRGDIDERRMLADAGFSASLVPALVPWIGAGEILIAILILCTWRSRAVFLFNAVVMALVTIAVAAQSAPYLGAAFNPVTLNAGVFALAIAGWFASGHVPSARRCLRTNPIRTQS